MTRRRFRLGNLPANCIFRFDGEASYKMPRMRIQVTRRSILAGCTAALLNNSIAVGQPAAKRPLKVVVAGAHPGDPEAGCGGTMAKYARLGHEVTALYLTRGEAGVAGMNARDAAAMRSAEAEAACKILKARPAFAAQIDAATEVNAERYREFGALLARLDPDVVFTQWPIDNHPDHRTCALLTQGAWQASGRRFALYFYEVDLGSDTQCFRPSYYVDVTATEPLKREACMAHRSQNPSGFYQKDHVPMMRFRGMECGRRFAEAFIHHDQSPPGLLPLD